jgi:hypothetical protein
MSEKSRSCFRKPPAPQRFEKTRVRVVHSENLIGGFDEKEISKPIRECPKLCVASRNVASGSEPPCRRMEAIKVPRAQFLSRYTFEI